ncbi:hypothetical protein RJ640_013354 [Escallonia rubra]|uniref:J domain-containing protein n=1 Tax=Escallonia rubra TaxID=112253 RepID=A0AA88R8U2_9ASTE|nr:hypothetical protein RJ640_013354 [Escallonia rubra]
MECNREEAIRARDIAEKKMQSDDYEGARKVALKAKQLFPELENISQLVAVCDVHCSAKNKIAGSDKDWYGILQVERLADEVTIKKQYRKLALILHPDKNKFPGAEAAFKLIGEANMVLSDQGKRSLYDRTTVRTVAPKPQNPVVRKPDGVQNRYPNVSNFKFSGLNHHQPTQSDMSKGSLAFWTCCPFCHIKYQYYKDFVNRALRCQSCQKPFIAYDLGAQGAPPVSNRGHLGAQGPTPGGQPTGYQQKQVPVQTGFNVGAQSTGSFPYGHMGSKINPSSRKAEPVTKGVSTVGVGGDLKTKGKEDQHVNTEDELKMPKFDAAKPRRSGASGNPNRKRGRKLVVESSESSASSSSVDTEEVFGVSGDDPAAGQSSELGGARHPRRSVRQKERVSYNENGSDDDDFTSPPKRSRESKPSIDVEEEQKEETLDNGKFEVGNSAGVSADADVDEEKAKRKGRAPSKESSLYEKDEAGKECEVNGEASPMDPGAKKSNEFDDLKSNSNLDSTPDPQFYECLDPEFNDFDKHKEEMCFSVGQVWACYDTIDGMPRFYAQVARVFSPGFKLRITWLEASPEGEGEDEWANEGLPVACGRFIRGSSEDTSDLPMFSHQMHWEKGSSRGSFVIYPRKGETWALFKNWDIRWSSDPDNHKAYKYEVVEVLSDFDDEASIRVAYLEKVEGFVCLFKKMPSGGSASFLITSSELLRFSHRVPSFKMTGKERKGVPEGSFELDTASLPCNLNELGCPGDVKMESESMDLKIDKSSPKPLEEKGKSTMVSEKMGTPKKFVDFDRKTDFDKEALNLRRSPREFNSIDKKHDQVYSTQEGASKHLNGNINTGRGDRTTSRENALSSQPDDERYIPSEEVFYNFDWGKSEDKFQVGQIWAMYNKDRLPKTYAQIRKIELSPFKLHAALLEEFVQPKTTTHTVSCGIFKASTGKARIFPPSSFSHMLKIGTAGKKKIEILPREGEIWALYKNWNADLSYSDLVKSEFEIVEVLKDTESSTKVTSLVRVTGYKSVFRAPRKSRSITDMEIPRDELARFSHQIPAFQLTTEKEGRLRGCWALDPALVPGNL